jgi:hypothetical protein
MTWIYSWLELGRNTSNIPACPTHSIEVMEAYKQQDNLGWYHFVRGRITIEWGNLISNHFSQQQRYPFTAEYWGSKIMSINWKYIFQLWSLCNTEVNGETSEKTESIKRQHTINEILHIQNTHSHLPHSARDLINRDLQSLWAMNTSSISVYLYGARMLVEMACQQHQDTGQHTLLQYFQHHQGSTTNGSNQTVIPDMGATI